MSGIDVSQAFAVFDEQDSGCVSYGVWRHGRQVFVKTARTPAARRSLRSAAVLHRAVRHPAIVHPLAVVDEHDDIVIVYPWCDGLVLNRATVHGSDRSALERFLALPIDERASAVGAILEAHEAVAAAGFVSVDLYDGCFLYDFDGKRMQLIDLDEYRPSPFTVDTERLPGSTRYMAPEEFVRGAAIDERTMVFHLGRTIAELTGSATEVVTRATAVEPAARFPTVAALIDAWKAEQ